MMPKTTPPMRSSDDAGLDAATRWKSFVVAIVSLFACSGLLGPDMVLERADTLMFHVSEVNAERLRLKVSGLSGHGAFAVRKIDAQRDGASILILVHLARARSGMSGSFDHELEVPAEVNALFFGRNRTMIWNRSARPTP